MSTKETALVKYTTKELQKSDGTNLSIREQKSRALAKKRQEYALQKLPEQLMKLYEAEEEKVYKSFNINFNIDNKWDKNLAYAIVFIAFVACFAILGLVNANNDHVRMVSLGVLILAGILSMLTLATTGLVIVRKNNEKKVTQQKQLLINQQLEHNFRKKVRLVHPEINILDFQMKKLSEPIFKQITHEGDSDVLES